MSPYRIKNRDRGPGRPSLEEVFARVDEEVKLLHKDLGGLPRAVEASEILREIWIDDVHNSTAIEGNTMTRAQVEDLVEKQKPSASLLETLEVTSYSRAADWVYRHARDYDHVSLDVVREVHKIAMRLPWEIEPPTTNDRPGDWRQAGVRVRDVKVSSPATIPADLHDWSESTKNLSGNHPLAFAAIHHAWFERIHHGYPPAVILATNRTRYLEGLRLADDGKPGSLAEVIARAVSGTLSRFLIPGLAGEAKLVPLSALAAKGPYSAVYLRQLVKRDKLRAIRDGNLWLSSRAWLDEYVRTRDPRGGPLPKPKRDTHRSTRKGSGKQQGLPLEKQTK
jgi:hypothetical protein